MYVLCMCEGKYVCQYMYVLCLCGFIHVSLLFVHIWCHDAYIEHSIAVWRDICQNNS